ncbi:MAG: AIR synthase-related protein, partial [Phycisphaerae bacterium]
KCISSDLKKPGNLLFVVGLTDNELGGSHYYKIHNQLGANVPRLDLNKAPKIAEKISQAVGKGLLASCHDCSEGGLAVALAEMAFAGGLGIEADLRALPKSNNCSRTDSQLFSESNSRYIVEIEPDKYDVFAKLMLNLPFGQIGKVAEDKKLLIRTAANEVVVDIGIDILKNAWQKTFAW